MNTITKIMLAGAVAMLPLSALAADTGKPPAELHGFDKYWSKMDPASKGFVAKDDWMAHAADRFKEIDTNGDGKISKEEMKANDEKMHQRFMEMRQHRRQMMDKGEGGK